MPLFRQPGGGQFNFFETIPLGAVATSAAVAANNAAQLTLFRVSRPITVAKLRNYCGAGAGNMDLGLYSSDGTTASVLYKAGTTVVSASAINTFTPSTPITLYPGIDYYTAIASDTTTPTFGSGNVAASVLGIFGLRLLQFTTSFPLPDSFTLSGGASNGRHYWVNGAPS